MDDYRESCSYAYYVHSPTEPPSFSQLLPNTSGITNKYLNHSGENNFKLNNWNVYSLTVKPSFQGQGIAKRLLKVGEDKACSSALPLLPLTTTRLIINSFVAGYRPGSLHDFRNGQRTECKYLASTPITLLILSPTFFYFLLLSPTFTPDLHIHAPWVHGRRLRLRGRTA